MSYNWQGSYDRSPSPISVWDSLAQSQSTSRFSDSSESLGNLVSYPARQKFNTNPFAEVGWNRNEDIQRSVWDNGVWDSQAGYDSQWNEGRNSYDQDIQKKNEEFYRKYYNDDTGWKRFEDRRTGWSYENFGNRKGGRSDWDGKYGFQGNKRFSERGGGSIRGGRGGSFSLRTNNQPYWGKKRSSYMDMELNRDILGDERYKDEEFQTDSKVEDKSKKVRPKIQNDEGHGKRKKEDSGEEKQNPSPKKSTEEVENKSKSKDEHLFKIPATLNKDKPIKNEVEQIESKTGESDNKEKISKSLTVHNESQKVEQKSGESPKGKTLSTSLSDSRGNPFEGSEKNLKSEEEKNNQYPSIKSLSKKIEEGNKMDVEIKPAVEIEEKTEYYKQEKKIGKEYCKLVKVYYCRLCKIHLPKIKSAKGVTAHCLTRDHLQKLMWELRTLNWPRPQGHNPQEINKSDSNINKRLDIDDNEELWSAIDQSFEDMLNDVST